MTGQNGAANKGRRFPVEVLTEDEVGQLLRACSSTAAAGVRDRALLTVLYRGGLRVSEALKLRPKDVDAKAGTLTVLHGKGDKRRVVGMDPGAFTVLERWLDWRRELGVGERAPVFCTVTQRDGGVGRAISVNHVEHAVKRLARKAGIEKRVHPHGLRHTHAAELAAEGVPANEIQEQLGHASLHTTDVYLRHIAPEARVQRMRERQWDPDGDGNAAGVSDSADGAPGNGSEPVGREDGDGPERGAAA